MRPQGYYSITKHLLYDIRIWNLIFRPKDALADQTQGISDDSGRKPLRTILWCMLTCQALSRSCHSFLLFTTVSQSICDWLKWRAIELRRGGKENLSASRCLSWYRTCKQVLEGNCARSETGGAILPLHGNYSELVSYGLFVLSFLLFMLFCLSLYVNAVRASCPSACVVVLL